VCWTCEDLTHCVEPCKDYFTHCAFYFSGYDLAMTWNECLALGATRLAACLGCSVSTAHTWIIRSGPAPWLQPILAAHVTRQIKKHNKAS